MKLKKELSTLTNIFLLLLFCAFTLNAQIHPDFKITKKIATTTVKNQYMTGTCWAFATVSFVETEAMRLGKPTFDLSEMFVVKNALTEKAIKYVRYHGRTNLTDGGQAHDVINMIRKYGIVTEEAYPGLQYGSTIHDHNELNSMLEGMLKGLVQTPNFKPSIAWLPSFNAAVETYLGKTPNTFSYQGKNYDPLKFAKEVVGINPDDYVELTSYKIYPYYKPADLEVPDNWSHDLYYNVPINDIVSIVDNAINNGYSVAWDGDVSEEEFNHSEGTAVLSVKESDGIITDGIEKTRQSTFDNYSTTDDHLMHITGLAKDNNGAPFYLVKNSWGENSNKYGGYLYMSSWYLQLKTIAILVHKDAIPKEIRKKMGI